MMSNSSYPVCVKARGRAILQISHDCAIPVHQRVLPALALHARSEAVSRQLLAREKSCSWAQFFDACAKALLGICITAVPHVSRYADGNPAKRCIGKIKNLSEIVPCWSSILSTMKYDRDTHPALTPERGP